MVAKRLPSDAYYDAEKVQSLLEELYPAMHQLRNSLKEFSPGLDEPSATPLEEESTLESVGRAICGHAKMLYSFGRLLRRMGQDGQ